jgi:hypothetical protein
MSTNSNSYLYKISQFISGIGHPIFIPLYVTWILFNSNNYLSYAVTPKFQDFLYLMLFVVTFLLPAVITWMLWQKGHVKSFELENKNERPLPYFLTLCCYIGCTYLLFSLPLPRVFGLAMSGACLALLSTIIINFSWKISLHMMGAGGMLGLFYGFALVFNFTSITVMVGIAMASGIIAAARLYCNAHTPAQVYSGFIIGFLLEFLFIYIFAPFIIGY